MKCLKCDRPMKKNGRDNKSLKQKYYCVQCATSRTANVPNIVLSPELMESIKKIPQIRESGENAYWTVDYFVEQIVRNQLKLEADYDLTDLSFVINNKIIE